MNKKRKVTDEWDSTLIFQYHPASILHQPRLLAVVNDDWEHLPTKSDASFTIVNTRGINWLDNMPVEYALDTENDPQGKLGEWSIAYRSQEGRLLVEPYEGVYPKFHSGKSNVCVFHHAKHDIRVLRRNGMTPPENIVDSFIAAYCMGLGRQEAKDKGRSGDKMVGGLGLKYLARRHLGMQMKTWQQVKDHPEEKAEYNANDSIATLLLWEKWKPDLPEHFWKIDMPMLDVCMAMEDRGMMVDPDFLRKYAEHLDQKLANIDLPINPFSQKQVSEYVYETLGNEPTRFTDNKQPSTDKEALEGIDDPIVKRILEYREFYKEKNTYVNSYINKMDENNRIHCDFKQTSTATGRLSSANPNLQNITLDRERKKSPLRSLFVADTGKLLVRMDFKQIELRVFAVLADDERMLAVFDSGRDPHQETADFLGIPRPEGRNVNFLMLFAGGAWKISQEFQVPIDRAKAMIFQYYRAYPNIKKFHEQQIEIAHTYRKATDWFGRTRRLDAMFSADFKTIKEGERECINMPIQGTAAEIVKLAMIDLHYKHKAPIVLQVHDELVFEVPEKDALSYGHWILEHVPTITEIKGIRFPIDVGIGKTWQESIDNEIKG